MDNLDDFLKGNDDAQPDVEAVTPPEPVEQPQEQVEEPQAETEGDKPKVERPRGPDGKFIPKGEEAGSPPAQESTIPESALLGERRRRQEAEQRLQQYEQYLAQLQQQQPDPDMFEDPDGFKKTLKEQIKAEAIAEARREAAEMFQYHRIATAAQQFMADKPDYQDAVNVFGQMAAVNPRLLAEMQAAPNPAEYAYNAGKTQVEIAQHGSLEALIQARVEAQLKAAQTPTATPQVPDTLADAQSSRGSAAPLNVPTLDEILKR
jgi:hypothetical protein